MASEASLRFELLREIFDLSRKQRDSLEIDDIESVIALMDEREHLVAQLMELATERAEELPPNVVRLPTSEDHARQDEIAIDTVLRGILEHDRRNEEILLEKMQAIREELPRIRRGRQAGAGYRNAGSEPGAVGGYADRVS